VEVYPSVYGVNIKTGEIFYVAAGLTSIEEMNQRVILIAKEKKWITEDEFKKTKSRNTPFMDRKISEKEIEGAESIEEVRDILKKKFKRER
jgi:hypothetical protein